MSKTTTSAKHAALIDRFAQHLAKGDSLVTAYRALHPRTRITSDELAAERAQAFVAANKITERVAEMLANRKLPEIYTPAQWLADAIVHKAAALAKGNHNAAQSYHRQIGQAIGVIGGQDEVKVEVKVENLDDAAIIARLAKGNPELSKALAKTTGDDKFKVFPATSNDKPPIKLITR